MPPKAEKKEKPVKGSEAEEMVLQYLLSVNRPYASTDVSANLKGRVTKPEAQRALTVLADKGLLTMKPYGKQTIFVYNQSQLPVLDPKEMADLDAEIKTVQTNLDGLRKELKSLQSELAATEALPQTKELSQEIKRVLAENEITTKALLPFQGKSAAPPMTAEETSKIDRDWVRWRKEWLDRRKVYNALIGMLGDGGAYSNKAEFEEEQGIEPDDEEAIDVDNGEFGKGAIKSVSRPMGKKAASKPMAAPTKSVLGKRSRSTKSNTTTASTVSE